MMNPSRSQKEHLPVLLAVVLLNYLAQIPYYLHQYYFPYHSAPSLVGTALLAVTLVWFWAGYERYLSGKQYGLAILLSFLLTQVLFYGHAIVLGILTGGGIAAQFRTHSPLLFAVFMLGYVNFVVAAYYAYRLIKGRAGIWSDRHSP